MAFLETLQDTVVNLLGPWHLMFISIQHIPQTVSSLISDGNYGTFFSPSGFSEALFGNLWATIGPFIRENGPRHVLPLLQGRVTAGEVHEQVVNQPVYGTVIEVGAGTGMWADVFKQVGDTHGGSNDSTTKEQHQQQQQQGLRKRNGPSTGAITKVYGVEPNPMSAAALRQRVHDIGLDGTYEVVPVGIEAVDDPAAWEGKIEPGSVDCIVCILCLCSIPEPEKNIKLLYRLLKPGGTWYVYEHVRVIRGGLLMSIYQRLVGYIWPIFMGSCRICRCTGKTLREAGAWKNIDLASPVDEPLSSTLPHVLGTLTKAD